MILVYTYIKQVDSRSYSPLDTYLLNNHNTGLYAKLLLVNAMPNVTTQFHMKSTCMGMMYMV